MRLYSLLCLLLSTVFAATPAQADLSRLQTLSQSPQWLALLHYERNGKGEALRSFVDDPRFFLHANGQRDPLAELLATREKLNAEPELRCRFIARYQWLVTSDVMPGEPQALAHCQQYWQWREDLNTERVVLVFAASYLNSPSSMYGHTFLRLDPRGERAESPLLSYALNFGAHVPPGDNSLLFAYRGLAGGYPGIFSLQPYYEKVQEYSRLENRDLWEYELNLNSTEINRLLAHAWELEGINFDYYFIDENCSFRLLELLEVARPGIDLLSPFGFHAIPVDTVRAVETAGLVDSVTYRPSRQVELQHLLDQLDSEQQQLAHELAEDITVLERAEFRSLADEQQRLVVLSAYRYLRYRHNRDQRSPAVAQRSLHLLKTLRHHRERDETPQRPKQSDDGHETALLSLSGGVEENRDIGELELRLSYHDLLDGVEGYPSGASLNMGRLLWRFSESESPQLQRLDLVEITSLAPRSRFFQPLSWRVNVGAERQYVGAREPLATQVNGGVGGSWMLAGVSPWVLATARLEYNEAFVHNWQWAPGLAAGLLWQRPWGALLLSAESYRFENGVDRQQYQLSLQKTLSQNQGLRLVAQRRLHDQVEKESVQLSWRYYF